MKTLKIKTFATGLLVLLFALVSGSSARAMEKAPENASEVRETLMGDLVADAMRDALGADVALINAGSLSPGEPPETITKKTVGQIVPYGEDLVALVKLTGEDLLAALEKSVSVLPKRFSGFLQVSGISFTCDMNEKSGSRISRVRVNGALINPEAVYKVALTDFLASGGSGYTSFKNGKPVEGREMALEDIVLGNAQLTDDLADSVGSRIDIIDLKEN
jgi:2',3'-cyclic-nucleotide 2'-phosphodiesterase (5'-nucleotidase family)